MLTGITVEADSPSYTEGQTAWFTFSLDQPAPQAIQVDLLVSGPPGGPTGYVLPIAQGESVLHVDFPTDDNSAPGDGYTLLVEITGSSEPGASGPFDSASTDILDDDGGGGGGLLSIPTVWVTTYSQYLIENEPAGIALEFHRSPSEGSLTVEFFIDGGTASSSDWISPVLASGSITFASDEPSAYLWVAAVEDSNLENSESLIVTILPSSAYEIDETMKTAGTSLHDGEHGLIATGFGAQWEDEGEAWKSVPQSDVLWDDANHRWVPNIPSGLGGQVVSVEFFARPHEYPSAPWESFAYEEFLETDTEYFVPGYPGVGWWDIRYVCHYGTLSWFVSDEYDWHGNGIAFMHWSMIDEDQRFRSTGSEHEVFAEMHYVEGDLAIYEKVRLGVTLLDRVPTGFTATVKLKVFDPDHPHNTTIEEWNYPADKSFDPNDSYAASNPNPGAELTRKPYDNRKTAGGLVSAPETGGTLDTNILVFPGGDTIVPSIAPPNQVQHAEFTIDEAQPGNNFVAVVARKLPNETENGVDKVFFGTDAVTLRYTWNGFDSDVPERYRSWHLTVWRTLWVELDSMTAPTNVESQGPFDQPNLPDGSEHPQYDKNLGDISNAPIDLLSQNFAPAKIEVRVLPSAIDVTDERFFFHYLEDMPGGDPYGQARDLRDLVQDQVFWIAHLIGGYESFSTTDFDSNEGYVPLGRALPGRNVAYIFFEEIRDRAAFSGTPMWPQTVAEDTLARRTTLHEVGHLMGAPHNTSPIGGIMNPESMYVTWDDAAAVYTVAQYGIFQAKSQPEWQGS